MLEHSLLVRVVYYTMEHGIGDARQTYNYSFTVYYKSAMPGKWLMMMMMMMMISKFNGTSTPKGSYSAKTGVNCPVSLNRVH